MKMKGDIVKSENLGRRKACSELLSVVTVAVVLMIAAPAFATSGFSFSFFFSDGYNQDARINFRHGRKFNREYNQNWDYFYNVPHRHDIGRRHIHKPWCKHRHDYDRRHNHKNNRLHRSDYRKHNYFNRR
jgi:hypothetical protein